MDLVADAGVPAELLEAFSHYILPHAGDVVESVGASAAPSFSIRLAPDGAPLQPSSGAPGMTLPASSARTLLAAGLLRQFANGLLLVPTLHVLARRGVFALFGAREAPREVALLDVARRVMPSGHERTLGNLAGALRMLALQHWLTLEGSDEQVRYTPTREGWTVIETLRDHVEPFAALDAALARARTYHLDLRRAEVDPAAVREYRRLVDWSASGWGLPVPSDAVARRVVGQLRRHLDGVLLGPTMVAFAVPVFVRDGNQTRAADRPFTEHFTAEGVLEVDSLAGVANLDLLQAALELFAQQGFLGYRDAQRRVVALTDAGRAMFRIMAAAAMPVSYLETYERLDEVLFVDPDPLGMAQDRHVNRVLNIFGSSSGASIETCRQVARTVLVKLFDATPLDQQPAGIADMGCGDGLALRTLAEFVIRETNRGKHLASHPLTVIGADFNEAPRERARATLAPLAAIDGVRVAVLHGDVGRPDLYDEEIRRLDLPIVDPATGARRPVGARDLLHTLMFLVHDRSLTVHERPEATSVLRDAVGRLDHAKLEQALSRSAGFHLRLPSDEKERLGLVAAQFTTPFSDKGAFVPGVVAAADLVRFMARWREYARQGLIVIEAHDVRPAAMNEPVPEDPRTWMRMEKLANPTVWGMHYLSRQFAMPYLEHELAMTLAGFEPMDGRVYGGAFTEALPQFRQISFACYR
jgi:hypothetical protein